MSRGGVNILLLLLIVLLGGVLAAEVVVLERWRDQLKTEARRSVDHTDAQPEEYWRVPDQLATVGAIDDLVNRPLFRPSRRPPEPEAPPPEPEPEQEPPPDLNLQLNSTIVTPQGSVAFFRDTEKDEFVRMGIGDEYEGWTLDIIVPEGVALSARGESVELRVRPSGAPDSGTAPELPPEPEPERPSESQPNGNDESEPGSDSDATDDEA